MEIAILVCDGVFDSGLAAILDVLDTANALAGEISEPPPWNVSTVGFRPQARTRAGHLVTTMPPAHADKADLLIVPAVDERRPEALPRSSLESAPGRPSFLKRAAGSTRAVNRSSSERRR